MSATPPGRRRPGRGEVPGRQLLGMLMIARGRREGLACFGDDSEAVLEAIAPWAAMWLGVGLLLVLMHRGGVALPMMALTACSLLAPPVLTEALSRLWGRRAFWPRFAAANLWCEWLMLPVYALALLVAAILTEAGAPAGLASGVFVLSAVGYWAWMHWFIARHGLRIGRLRAGMLVVALVAVMTLLGLAGERLLPQLRGPLVPHVEVEDDAVDATDGGSAAAPRPAQQDAAGDWRF